MKKNILIHIPHSSLRLPKIFYDNVLKDINYIEKENIYLSDFGVDKLIDSKKYNILKFNYSRMFCDVERYKDDNKEIMSRYGMGVLYEKDSKGVNFIKFDNDYRDFVIDKYYNKHHNKLNVYVKDIIDLYGSCIIIDLHSFSDNFVYSMFGLDNNPDICIGYDEKFIDYEILNIIKNIFLSNGYSVEFNKPYSGSIIPNNFINLSNHVLNSVMIEINKRLYLNNNKIIEKELQKLKKCLDQILKSI